MLTLGTTYYNCPDYLERFVENHIDDVDSMIIVDDGSQEDLKARHFVDQTPKISLYEVTEDIGFNSHGCRNLIMSECQTEWCILMDCDRQIINNGIKIIQEDLDDLDKNTRYSFSAHFLKKGTNTHVSVNDYLITKNTFWLAGGYDEELVGIRTGDREYFCQLAHFSKHDVLVDIDMILTRSATFHNPVKINHASVAKVNERLANPVNDKPILRFCWRQMF